MNNHDLYSQEIQSIDYDISKQNLEIKFQSGSIYQYSEVPQLVYQGLLNSTSPIEYIDSLLTEHYNMKVVKS